MAAYPARPTPINSVSLAQFLILIPHPRSLLSSVPRPLETVSYPISYVLICWFCVHTFEASQIFLIDLRSKKVFVVPAVQNFSDLHT